MGKHYVHRSGCSRSRSTGKPRTTTDKRLLDIFSFSSTIIFFLLQPIENFSEWRLLYFIAFILLVGFFVLNMFVGVVVENFHRCREEQEKEERVRRLAKRAKQLEKKRRSNDKFWANTKIVKLLLTNNKFFIFAIGLRQPPYYAGYGKTRLLVHNIVTSKYFDLAIAAVIGLNVITMAMEFYMMPKVCDVQREKYLKLSM